MVYLRHLAHFGHSNIIKYCNRPFSSTHEMDETLLNNINRNVQSSDILYHLGDFCFGSRIEFYRKQINCRQIHLVLGNHDKLKNSDKKLFASISSLKEIKINNCTIVLCHYAMRVWNKSHHGSLHFFGHSHGGLGNTDKSIDVGVDSWNYKPISLSKNLQIVVGK